MSTTLRSLSAHPQNDSDYGSGYLDGLDDGKRRVDLGLVFLTAIATVVAVICVMAVAFHMGGAA